MGVEAAGGSLPVAGWKLAVARPRAGVVPRPRLFALLDRHADAPLTLITAPVGFGKTELLASWLEARSELAVAWMSADPADVDPLRFWT